MHFITKWIDDSPETVLAVQAVGKNYQGTDGAECLCQHSRPLTQRLLQICVKLAQIRFHECVIEFHRIFRGLKRDVGVTVEGVDSFASSCASSDIFSFLQTLNDVRLNS